MYAARCSARSASEHACEPNSGVFSAASGTEPLAVTWYCTALCPDRYTALPAALTQVKVALPLPAANRSPMRPPQPDVEPSGADDCQTDCWSLCENSLGGNRTDWLVYSSLLVGCTSVPRLSITAIWPALKIGTSGNNPGASAYWRPAASAMVGASTVPASVSRAIAMDVRCAWYAV